MPARDIALSRWQVDVRPAGVRPPRVAAVVSRPVDLGWDALLVCVALYILSAVGRVHQLFPALQVLHPAMLAGVLAIALYAADGRGSRRMKRIRAAPIVGIVGLFLWMVMSIPTALVIGNSIDMVTGNFAKTMVMTIVVAASIRGMRDVERLMLVYLTGASIYAAVAILRFDLGGGGDWRLGHLYYYDANDLATFLVTAMPIALYFANARRGWLGRCAAAASLLLMTIAFVRTGSRGGFIALGVVIVYVVLYAAVSVRQRVGAVVAIAAVVALTASGRYWSQMASIGEDTDYNRTEQSGRLHIWERGIGYMAQHPLFGVGAGNFETAEGTISPLAYRQELGFGVMWNAAHNSYIQTGAELGVPGVVLFTVVIVTTLRGLAAWKRREAGSVRASQLSQTMSASIIGFAVGAFFLSLAYHELLYTLVAVSVGLTKERGTCASHT